MEHLKELRKRILLALVGIIVGAFGGWFVYEPVMAFITGPLKDMADSGTQINFPTIGSALDLKLRVSLWAGLMLASPWWIYQLGAFIMPGLKRKERIYVILFGAVGVLLFLGGAYTGVRLVPEAVKILQSFVPIGGISLLQADTYVDFYLRLVILFGISFLIPEVLVVLNFLGVLSARAMLRGWRWAVLTAFTFAAIANPLPSPWPMIVQAMLLVALYLVAVLISWIHDRYKKYGRRLRPAKQQSPGPHQAQGYTSGQAAPAAMSAPTPTPYPAPAAPPYLAPATPSYLVAGVPTSRITGVVVLAGGTAKRLGGVSKPDVVVGQQTLLSRAINEIRVAVPGVHIVVVAPPQVNVPQGVARVLEDPPFGGPTAGVAAGFALLQALPGYRPDGLVALLTCDAPLAPRLYPQLERAFAESVQTQAIPGQAIRGGASLSGGASLRGGASLSNGPSAQVVGGAVPYVNDKGGTYSQYLHGVYAAGALAQLFAGEVRDRSVRSLFSQLRLTGIPDAAGWGVDVDTWEDAAALEQKLAEPGEPSA